MDDCREETTLVCDILTTEKSLLKSIQSKLILMESAMDVERLNFLILFVSESFSLYKSSTLMSLEGYFVSSIISTRSLIECIINCKYVINDETNRRIKAFQNKPFKWTNTNISHRANSIGERNLYKSLYRLSSNYTHLNYVSLAQKIDGNNVVRSSPFYRQDGVKKTLNINSAIMINFLKYINDKFALGMNVLNEIIISKHVEDLIELFRCEDVILDKLAEIAGMNASQKDLMIKEYRSHLNRINKGNSKRKRKRK